MIIVKTDDYEELMLNDGQEKQISSAENMRNALKKDNCTGYYAYEGSARVGFALIRKFAEKQFFLWDFLIDCRYQGAGKGREFLRLLIDTLAKDYSAEVITTTYIFGNSAAQKLYESRGFTQTDVVCEGGVHEVNMMLKLDSPR